MKTILVDAFNTFVIKDHGIDQDMYKLLETFPNKKIILTNANDEELVKFGLVDLPYEIFSLKHEPNKTDPKYNIRNSINSLSPIEHTYSLSSSIIT